MLDIMAENIRHLCQTDAIYWTEHVGKRLIKRLISPDEVIQVLLHGDIIEHYQDDYPFPSCLIFAIVGMRPLHVVCSIGNEQLYVITAYQTDSMQWDETFTKRSKEGGSS
jgi:hypothetical protein